MRVTNVHQRLLHASPEQVGALIDAIGSPHDGLWPGAPWPPVRFDGPLQEGTRGGHGPIRYVVESHVPGQSVRFRLTAPRGFDGWHGFEVLDATRAHCVLEHRIEMQARGRGALLWALAIRWLHDACLRDLLAQAERSLGLAPRVVDWSPWVRLLMWASSRPSARRVIGRSKAAA